MNPNSGKGRIVRWVLRAGPVVVVLSLVILWLCFQRRPGWYRPAILDQDGVRRASSAAVAWADDVSDRMVRADPFKLVLSNEEVTEFAAILPELFPDEFAGWPPELTLPAVAFADGFIHVGFHCEREGWRLIAVVELAVEVNETSQEITVALAGVRGGSLPIPRFLLRKQVDPIIAREISRLEKPYRRHGQHFLNDLAGVDDLIEGVQIPNRFVWPNGKRPFRITQVDASEGKLNLWIRPL
ncbi:MAG: hypothetical protein ACYTHJ_03830 [Planctomycetota bacterium]